ncbi:hypothetical protein NDU88_000498 [Pleurodeles waltl]|uniref:Reverse transcriptase domain-containing protein n=1 Tax=Pleurodeles waltl TaxID=8319 RepID=A0AAV7TF62_PLEWA|nr:hypothetical protein NDU88_000498 [Pleurodeles waltl]
MTPRQPPFLARHVSGDDCRQNHTFLALYGTTPWRAECSQGCHVLSGSAHGRSSHTASDAVFVILWKHKHSRWSCGVLGWLLMAPKTLRTARMLQVKPSMETNAGRRDKKQSAAPSKTESARKEKEYSKAPQRLRNYSIKLHRSLRCSSNQRGLIRPLELIGGSTIILAYADDVAVVTTDPAVAFKEIEYEAARFGRVSQYLLNKTKCQILANGWTTIVDKRKMTQVRYLGVKLTLNLDEIVEINLASVLAKAKKELRCINNLQLSLVGTAT